MTTNLQRSSHFTHIKDRLLFGGLVTRQVLVRRHAPAWCKLKALTMQRTHTHTHTSHETSGRKLLEQRQDTPKFAKLAHEPQKLPKKEEQHYAQKNEIMQRSTTRFEGRPEPSSCSSSSVGSRHLGMRPDPAAAPAPARGCGKG